MVKMCDVVSLSLYTFVLMLLHPSLALQTFALKSFTLMLHYKFVPVYALGATFSLLCTNNL
jgi:hypothetical protein